MATLKKIAQQKGWEYKKHFMYGQEGNYLITARQIIDLINSRNNCKLVYIPLMNITEEKALTTVQFLKENKKQLKITDFEFRKHVLVIRLNEGLKGFSTDNFNNLIRTLINFFKNNDISNEKSCVYCGNNEVNTTTLIDNISYHAHNECIRKAKNDLEQAKQNFELVNKNYGKGFIGAIIGALIGSIPWIILELFWGFAGILAIVIGYAAFYGYKKFGGIVTKATKWMIGVSILIGIIFSSIVNLTIAFIINDIPLILDAYILAYTEPETSRILLGNLGLALLISSFGFYSIFRSIQEEEFKTEIE